MRRREFIVTLGSAAAVWPLAARAQQSRKVPLIGVLWPNPPSQFEFIRQGLADLGYVEGKNINFEFRWAEGALDKLPELAMELVRIPVDLIVTLAPPATLAAQRATRTIPIVFVAMGDPLASGVVASLAHPGANLTGTTRMISEMSAKHVELLKEVYPALSIWRFSGIQTIHRTRQRSGPLNPRPDHYRFKFAVWKCEQWLISKMFSQRLYRVGPMAFSSSQTLSFSSNSNAWPTS